MGKPQKLDEDPEVVRLIYAMAWDPRYADMKHDDIGAIWGLTGTTVSNIKTGRTHRDITEGMRRGKSDLLSTDRKRRSRAKRPNK